MAHSEVPVVSAMPESSVETKKRWRSNNLPALNLLLMFPMLSIFTQGDPFGCKIGLATGATICVIEATLQAAAQNLPMFVVARGILGCGTVFLGSSGAPLITKIAHRATATALFNTSYALGAIVAGWTTAPSISPRAPLGAIPSGLQALPSVIQLLGLFFVLESQRWLVSKDQHSEAVAYERSIDRGSMVQNYLEFVRTPGNLKRLFILLWSACIAQMSGNAFISYYFSPVLTSMLSWFSALYFATLPEKLGCRTLFIASLCAIFVYLVSITAGSAVFANNPSNKAAGAAVVAFLYLFSPTYNLGLNGNQGFYIAEILPFNLRMRGQACFHLFSTCFTLLSTYAVPMGLERMAWKFYCIFVPWVLVELVVLWFAYLETRGPALEEIAFLFNGPDANLSRPEMQDVDVERAEVERTEAKTKE